MIIREIEEEAQILVKHKIFEHSYYPCEVLLNTSRAECMKIVIDQGEQEPTEEQYARARAGEYVDPEEPTCKELVCGYGYLFTEELPLTLLGEWLPKAKICVAERIASQKSQEAKISLKAKRIEDAARIAADSKRIEDANRNSAESQVSSAKLNIPSKSSALALGHGTNLEADWDPPPGGLTVLARRMSAKFTTEKLERMISALDKEVAKKKAMEGHSRNEQPKLSSTPQLDPLQCQQSVSSLAPPHVRGSVAPVANMGSKPRPTSTPVADKASASVQSVIHRSTSSLSGTTSAIMSPGLTNKAMSISSQESPRPSQQMSPTSSMSSTGCIAALNASQSGHTTSANMIASKSKSLHNATSNQSGSSSVSSSIMKSTSGKLASSVSEDSLGNRPPLTLPHTSQGIATELGETEEEKNTVSEAVLDAETLRIARNSHVARLDSLGVSFLGQHTGSECQVSSLPDMTHSKLHGRIEPMTNQATEVPSQVEYLAGIHAYASSSSPMEQYAHTSANEYVSPGKRSQGNSSKSPQESCISPQEDPPSLLSYSSSLCPPEHINNVAYCGLSVHTNSRFITKKTSKRSRGYDTVHGDPFANSPRSYPSPNGYSNVGGYGSPDQTNTGYPTNASGALTSPYYTQHNTQSATTGPNEARSYPLDMQHAHSSEHSYCPMTGATQPTSLPTSDSYPSHPNAQTPRSLSEESLERRKNLAKYNEQQASDKQKRVPELVAGMGFRAHKRLSLSNGSQQKIASPVKTGAVSGKKRKSDEGLNGGEALKKTKY
ncbi:hypothetical protein EJ05DRAFT_288286 [Pseudovirgaria hyperparasitica]|uniref:Uncharacterized protein n=1 Tax=Pseudovirgaria hyperparasitica TaxID=470096 RepID=A0A6A6WEF7_9PEZI|nr:uncharacterized protein EJ05DRAFT_288286 [Pseudovirgaria hyperparasitica]KAF2760539.1 hypothetical protein EJ05DRAFT_288286 [Pseudovirgaria hyperparasitica]